MTRALLLPAILCLLVTSLAEAQEIIENKPSPVAELFEDETAFLIEHLNNQGATDASHVERREKLAFSGDAFLLVTPFQRFNARIPGWKFEITKDPEPGQYRYLRFAWKRTEAPAIMLQLHAAPNRWHRYYSGTVNEKIQAWGAMTCLNTEVPRKWELVTRDLFADFGPMTITGLGLSALDEPGIAGFDHIYLGRTIEDLDHITAAKKNPLQDAEDTKAPDTPSSHSHLLWAIAIILSIMLSGILIVALLLHRRQESEPEK